MKEDIRKRASEYRQYTAENLSRLVKIPSYSGREEAVCREIGEEPAVVALAWLLHNPVVTAPIIGPRTMAQLESAVRATELVLDEETLGRLDEIWPGPGNQAPEAYAW